DGKMETQREKRKESDAGDKQSDYRHLKEEKETPEPMREREREREKEKDQI
ncbi:hypothetical protein RUM43_001882, partial [Polyplax serrata]